jgi:hypothetical protein
VWATNKVGWAHCQVGGSSGRPDPLVGVAMSLVGGDPGVPMSHKPRARCRRNNHRKVMTKSQSYRQVE